MATNDVCFSVDHSGLTSIIGPNGAGKTTFINLITGKIGASSGKILFEEKDITNMPTHELVKQGICRTFQINSLFENLSVFENLRIARQAKVGGSFRIFCLKQKLKSVIKDTWAMLERLGLEKMADQPAKNLAYGDQRVLEVAIAMAGDPKVLFLDEPTAGMSPAETHHIADLIKDLAKDISVVLVEHDMDMVMRISDRITVLQDGGIISEGTPEQIRNNQHVKEAYLGKAA
jgi:branched-chain amino acid transport system ATP-binding protein